MLFPRHAQLPLLASQAVARMSSLCTARHGVEHHYPWSIDELYRSPSDRLSLIGYGSLMNLTSARRSLNEACIATAKPVIVLGARRVYERVMSPKGRGVYGEKVDDAQLGVLNAHLTGERSDWFNGVMFQVGADDIPALLSRESAYDLLPAWTMSWDESSPQPYVAYFLSCRQMTFAGRPLIDSQILPHPRYHEICEAGCEAISSDFLHAFRTTTWVRQSRLIDAEQYQLESA
ncbi:hypothetical protein [Blastopirellula marina]|uniref:hypothetical protein n=1 Tax=Blastopirellula marina TaxID=124 RepID=UPI0011AFE916|nr:hypothetical protein [Blastopirellula marina]